MEPKIEDVHPPVVEIIKKEPVRGLIQQRSVVEGLLDKTWQRRMVIEGILSAPDPAEYLTRVSPAMNSRLFTSGDLQYSHVVEGSSLHKLIAEARDPQADKIALVETYLLGKAREEYPQLHGVTLGSLPIEVFARPEDDASLALAVQLTTGERQNTPVDDYLISEEVGKGGYRPFLETVLEAEWNRLTAQIGINVLSDEQTAQEYYKEWIKEQKKSPDRTVFTPTYRELAKECHAYMRRNGKNRTIARSAAYGPPGQGKTEFYRALNRIDGKSTMVISARPHLGYEELVGTVQILSKDNGTILSTLAREYQRERITPELATINLFQVSRQIALKQIETIEFAEQTSREDAVRTFQLQWLVDVAGIPQDKAEVLSKALSVEELKSANLEQDFFKAVQDAFINNLLQKATSSAFNVEESTKYLRGLILTADKLGMRVIIDEAEKIYKGNPNESPSFGGLEDVLTMQPGSVIRVGDIAHRFSEDFCIDLSMNEQNIPAHIKSRFGERAFYVEANSYDRMAIAAVGIANGEGEFGLSPQAQEKIIFFTSFAWPAIARAAKSRGEPFDLRLLQNVLSSLIHDGRSRNQTLADALGRIPQPTVKRTIARFAALLPKLNLSALTSAGRADMQSLGEPESPFLEVLREAPEGIDTTKVFNSARLTEAEIEKLAADKKTTPPNTTDQVDALTARITLRYGDTPEPNLLFTSKLTGDVYYDGKILLRFSNPEKGKSENPVFNPTAEDPLALHVSSSFGTTILVRQKDVYCALDATGVLSAEVYDNVIRPVSPGIQNPSDIKLSPIGDYLYYTQKEELFCQRLGLFKSESGIKPVDPFKIDIPGGSIPLSINITRDGNYALVACENDKFYLIDLSATQKTGHSIILTPDPLEGKGWDIDTFQNALYLFNPISKQGFRIS